LQFIILTRHLYAEYIKNALNATVRKLENPIRKRCKRLKHFSREIIHREAIVNVS
jgi:hypothetical protein